MQANLTNTATTTIRKYSTIRQIPTWYDYCESDNWTHLLELVGMSDKANTYGGGFALLSEGEILELWGFVGTVPYLSKFVTLLYSSAIHDEIDHIYFAIGELAKTKRYPKTLKTFRDRVYAWIAENVAQTNVALSNDDIQRFTVIAAYNRRWVIKHAIIEHYGINPDSLWLER